MYLLPWGRLTEQGQLDGKASAGTPHSVNPGKTWDMFLIYRLRIFGDTWPNTAWSRRLVEGVPGGARRPISPFLENLGRRAHIEVQRLWQQVAAPAATRRLQEVKLRAETETFRVGRSTTLLVAQAQRDLLQS